LGFDQDCVGGVAAACATVLDELEEDDNQIGAELGNISTKRLISAPTVFNTRASVTVDVDQNNSTICFVGCAMYRNTLVRTCVTKITEGGGDIIAETSASNVANEVFPKISRGMVTGISSGAHTYDLETRVTATDVTTCLTHCFIIAIVITI